MKRYIYILALLFAVSGCARREIIPDAQLADIFHDVMLANSYKHNFPFDVDSLRLYEPIFEKYGYSAEDVNYTVGNFSKRKSARLSDVVELAIARLESESARHKREVVILDSIDLRALQKAREVVYRDSVVKLLFRRDSADMIVTIDEVRVGEYRVQFDYLVDSTDRNNLSYRTLLWFEKAGRYNQARRGEERTAQRFSQNSTYLTKHKVSSYNKTIISDGSESCLRIHLAEWRGNLRFAPNVTIKNIKVTYTPRVEQAVELLYENLLDLRLFSPIMYEPYSLTRATPLPEPPIEADSLLVSTAGE